MSALAPAFDAALAGDRAIVTLLMQVQLPARTMRLLVGGRGFVDWNGNRFTDTDPVYGTISAIDAIEDGDGDQAPSVGFTMLPPSDSAAAALCSPANQGAPMAIWLAGIHPTTGLVIPDPYRLFSGVIDQPRFRPGRGKREVEFECVSEFELLLEGDEGARLSDAFHQSNWPGETGFANITGVERDIYWGVATPAAGAITRGTNNMTGNPIP